MNNARREIDEFLNSLQDEMPTTSGAAAKKRHAASPGTPPPLGANDGEKLVVIDLTSPKRNVVIDLCSSESSSDVEVVIEKKEVGRPAKRGGVNRRGRGGAVGRRGKGQTVGQPVARKGAKTSKGKTPIAHVEEQAVGHRVAGKEANAPVKGRTPIHHVEGTKAVNRKNEGVKVNRHADGGTATRHGEGEAVGRMQPLRQFRMTPYAGPTAVRGPSRGAMHSAAIGNLKKRLIFVEDIKCPICLEFCAERTPTVTSCDHIFCSECIRTLLVMTTECPVCYRQLSPLDLKTVDQ